MNLRGFPHIAHSYHDIREVYHWWVCNFANVIANKSNNDDMRKNLLCLLCASLTGIMPLSARVLNADEALKAVQRTPGNAMMRASLASGLQLSKTINTTTGTPALYLFKDGKGDGTVIASAESLTPALLGYTTTSVEGQHSPAFEYWLACYADQIEYLRAGVGTHIGASSSADFAVTSLGEAVAPICQTKWDQDAPYNNLCPKLAGAQTATGCVATAMAQVMKAFNYPTSGSGSISYTWKNSGETLSQDFTTDTYDWENMLPTYYQVESNATQQNAIATLMRDAGYAVKMNYGNLTGAGSSATDSSISGALINNFGYDVAIYKAARDTYALEDWNQLIYDELAKGHPIIYNGVNNNVQGHSFVCDGYDGDGYYHINWGWSGIDNGYFLLSALAPAHIGIGGGNGNGFNYQQSAILGIQKPQADSCPHLQMTLNDDFDIDEPSSGGVDDVFQFSGTFLNSSSVSVSGNAGVKITGEDGAVVYVAGSRLNAFPANYFFTEYQVDGKEMPHEPGTYTVQPAFYGNDDQAWHDMLIGPQVRSELTMTVTQTTRSFASQQDSGFAGTVYASDLTITPTSLSVGEEFTAHATLHNETDQDYTGSLHGVLIQENQGNYYSKGQASDMTISIPAGTTQELTYNAKFSNAERGTFDFYLSIGNDLICQPVKVTIVAGAEEPNADADLYALSVNLSTRNLSNRTPFNVKATLYNLGSGTFNGTIYGALVEVKDGKAVFVAKGAEKEVSVEGNYSSLDIDYDCCFTGVAPGDYDFYIMEGNNDISNPVAVSVSDSTPSGALLTLTDFQILSGRDGEDGVREVAKNAIRVQASIQCEAGEFNDEIAVCVCDERGNYLGDLCSQEFNLREGQTGILIGQGDFPEATEGAQYLMAIFHGYDQIGGTILPFRINSDAAFTLETKYEEGLRMHDGVLELMNAPTQCTIALYTPTGICLNRIEGPAMPIDDLPQGLYVATATTPTGTTTLRFTK